MSQYWMNCPAHGEKSKLNISMIPITVVATKYDIFAQQNEPVAKKALCAALRYICHRNGCDLVFTSIQEERPMRNFRNMMQHHMFKDFSKFKQDQDSVNQEEGIAAAASEAPEFQMYPNPEKDSVKAMAIYAGTDSERSIGEPPGASMRHNVGIEQLWQEVLDQHFQKTASEEKTAQGLTNMKKYVEEKVDKMRVNKDQELEDYRKEIEKQKKYERQKLQQQLTHQHH